MGSCALESFIVCGGFVLKFHGYFAAVHVARFRHDRKNYPRSLEYRASFRSGRERPGKMGGGAYPEYPEQLWNQAPPSLPRLCRPKAPELRQGWTTEGCSKVWKLDSVAS
jgi:hypothetical protein